MKSPPNSRQQNAMVTDSSSMLNMLNAKDTQDAMLDKNDLPVAVPKADEKIGQKIDQKAGQKIDQKTGDKPRSGWRKLVADNVRLVAIALTLAFFIRFFIAEPRFIPSPSMVPTLVVGDRLLVEKVSYHLHLPHAGDIAVFEPPPQLQEYGYLTSQAFIKRVIGLPGQTVQVSQGQVIVNAQPLNEPYILAAPNYEMPPVTVPAGSLFVMGDNRNDSNDSHVWGFLPIQNVIGRAVFRFWPLEKIGRLNISD